MYFGAFLIAQLVKNPPAMQEVDGWLAGWVGVWVGGLVGGWLGGWIDGWMGR